MSAAKWSYVLIVAISLLMYKFISFEPTENVETVKVVHFEHASSCGKTCVSANRIYYVKGDQMKSWNVGSNEYWKGALVDIDRTSTGGVYLALSILLTIVLLPVSYFAVDENTK